MGDGEPSLSLDCFLEKAEKNRHILKDAMAGWYSAFQEIAIAQSAIMTPDVIQTNHDKLALPVLLANCAYAYFAAAVDIGLSAQIGPCFALQRTCIESVVYAHAVMRRPELGSIWLWRDDSPADKHRFDEKFKITVLMDELPDAKTGLREAIRELYRTTISYGAHPNPNGALSGADIGENEERVWVSKGFFVNGLPLQLALKSTAEVGYAMVWLEDLMFGLHFAPVTLPERIDRMAQDVLRELKTNQGNVAEESKSNG